MKNWVRKFFLISKIKIETVSKDILAGCFTEKLHRAHSKWDRNRRKNMGWVGKKKKRVKRNPAITHISAMWESKKAINKNRYCIKSVPGKLREQNVPNDCPANLYWGKCSVLMQTALFLLAGLPM